LELLQSWTTKLRAYERTEIGSEERSCGSHWSNAALSFTLEGEKKDHFFLFVWKERELTLRRVSLSPLPLSGREMSFEN
jgi:hypothetical protein